MDSIVDLTSGFVIWCSNRAIKNRDRYHYPRGRTRLEPLGLIIISVIMGVASLFVIVKTIDDVVRGRVDPIMGKWAYKNGTNETSGFVPDWGVLAPMLATIVVKFTLYIVCYVFARESPTIMVLAQDHRNDTISNSVAIVCGFMGSMYWRYIDAIGAILVSLYIATTWVRTGVDQTAILSGRSASSYFISRIIKICLDHHREIQHVDAVAVYHFGSQYIVEVDIVLRETMTVRRAHEISEPLQSKLEQLQDVERAFVHVDYQTKHWPFNEHKSV